MPLLMQLCSFTLKYGLVSLHIVPIYFKFWLVLKKEYNDVSDSLNFSNLQQENSALQQYPAF